MMVHTEEKTREAKSLFLHKWNFIKWKKREMILSLLKAKKMFLYQIKANKDKSDQRFLFDRFHTFNLVIRVN